MSLFRIKKEFFFVFKFIFGCAGSFLLCVGFTSCNERGLLQLRWVHGLLIVVASLVAEHCFQGSQASVIVAHRLSGPAACGIFPDQGSNPCPLQADSYPLHPQGSPEYFEYNEDMLKWGTLNRPREYVWKVGFQLIRRILSHRCRGNLGSVMVAPFQIVLRKEWL